MFHRPVVPRAIASSSLSTPPPPPRPIRSPIRRVRIAPRRARDRRARVSRDRRRPRARSRARPRRRRQRATGVRAIASIGGGPRRLRPGGANGGYAPRGTGVVWAALQQQPGDDDDDDDDVGVGYVVTNYHVIAPDHLPGRNDNDVEGQTKRIPAAGRPLRVAVSDA